MEIYTRHIGVKVSGISPLIEITIKGSNGCEITEDITNLNSFIDESFINDLRNIADELEDQNNKINLLYE